MSKRRSFFLFILALVVAGAASWVANNWMLDKMAPPAGASTLPVVTAALTIASNTQIEEKHLKLVEMPPNLIPAGAIRNPNDIVGKYATQSVFPGELMFTGRFAEDAEKPVIAAVTEVIQPDMRAVAIYVDSVIGMGTYMRPGSQIDILASRQRGYSRSMATIETIVQNVKVLSVDQAALPDANTPLMSVRAVTVEVSPYQAEILANASEGWSLIAAIRPVES